MADLEVRELRYFRAVAEELNFSRAAQRLGIAQPPLSRAIRQLERRLGVELFRRNSREVALTDAGRILFDGAERVLAAVSAAAHRTRRASARPTLVVTAKPGVATDLLRRIVAAVAQEPGAPQVEIAVGGYDEQADMVRDGRADLALLGSPLDYPGLEFELLLTEPRVAAIPVGHELARREQLSCRDFAGQPMPQRPGSTAAQREYWASQASTRRPLCTGRWPGTARNCWKSLPWAKPWP
jgi:DNA-binding transcriptional LysR family regulator